MVIFQKPNPPLIAMAIGYILSIFTGGIFKALGTIIFIIAGVIWSYLEITSGVNTFRKALGWIVMAFMAYSLFIRLR